MFDDHDYEDGFELSDLKKKTTPLLMEAVGACAIVGVWLQFFDSSNTTALQMVSTIPVSAPGSSCLEML